jgi:hypothetical protein
MSDSSWQVELWHSTLYTGVAFSPFFEISIQALLCTFTAACVQFGLRSGLRPVYGLCARPTCLHPLKERNGTQLTHLMHEESFILHPQIIDVF